MIKEETLADVRKILAEVSRDLDALHGRIEDSSRDGAVCAGYPDYVKVSPAVYLKRAHDRLAKRGYRVAFAGGFSAGKSTLVNALLTEPGLLPVAIGVCTATLTIVTAPEPGQPEHLQVHYHTDEMALRNIFENPRYETLLRERKDEALVSFEPARARAAIQQAVDAVGRKGSVEDAKKAAELREFLGALLEFKDRLGTIYMETDLARTSQYLTTDKEDRGMGHILLISRVVIYRDNPIFTRAGVEIIDLPGTDSTNPRDRELTHNFLREADVIVSVITPRGFSEADVRIREIMGGHHHEIRNKIFVVVNRWDSLTDNELSRKDDLHRVYREQIRGEMARAGVRGDHLFLTTALWEELTAKKKRAKLDESEMRALDSFERNAGRARANLPPGLDPDLLERLGPVYQDGGVTALRQRLMDYLRQDIEAERMIDVFRDLERVLLAASEMFAPERQALGDLLEGARDRRRRIQELEDSIAYAFEERLGGVEKALEEGATKDLLAEAKEKLRLGIRALVSKDTKTFSIARIIRELNVAVPVRIKQEAILVAKQLVGDKLVEMVEGAVVDRLLQKIRTELDATGIAPVLDQIGAALGKNVREPYDRQVERLQRDIRLATTFRSREEAWKLREVEMVPGGVEVAWNPDVEASFRKTLEEVLTKRVATHMETLSTTLWRYYRMTIEDAIRSFKTWVAELSEDLKFEDVPLPTLGAEPDASVARRRLLAEFIGVSDAIGRKLGEARASLGIE